jgi:hypothetical protein
MNNFFHSGCNWILANSTEHRHTTPKGPHHSWQWITSPMRFFDCQASFQHLMESVLQSMNNAIVNIDDLLTHTQNHKEHLKVLDQVLQRLKSNYLKINLDKCIFGNKEVSYLAFTLTPKGIKPVACTINVLGS